MLSQDEILVVPSSHRWEGFKTSSWLHTAPPTPPSEVRACRKWRADRLRHHCYLNHHLHIC
jgi:hypothetical protein